MGFQLATTITPHIKELIQAFEIPEAAGQGASKKDAVMAAIQAILVMISQDIKDTFGDNNVISFISTMIDIIVKFLNNIGVFKSA